MKIGFAKISGIFLSSRYWTQLILTVITGGVRLTWTPKDGAETEIYVSINGAAYSLVTTVGLTVGTYDYMDNGTHLLAFKLRYKIDGTILNIPTTLALSDLGGGTVRITWLDNNTEADHIEIYGNIASGGTNLLTTVLTGVQTYDYATGSMSGIDVKIKLRAKEGTLPVYSSFTSEVDIKLAATYDSDASALFARMTAITGETLTDARKVIINAAFTLGKTKAFWAKTDCIWTLAAHGEASHLMNWLGTGYTLIQSATKPTFTMDRGGAGNGSTSYYRTQYSPGVGGKKFTLNSASLGGYSRTSGSDATYGRIMGALSSTAVITQIAPDAGGTTYVRINTQDLGSIADTSGAGLYILTKTGGTTATLYIGTTPHSYASSSTSLPTELLICASWDYQHNIAYPSARQVAFAIFGSGFTQQDITDIFAVFVTGYLTSIGANV